jgi:two-component system chemotaxis response regulator CheB
MPTGRKTRVLIVDDSAIVRKILAEALAGEVDLEVVGTAPDPYVARDKILTLQPDVLTLDIEMPRMDGLTFLKKLMQFHPLPTVVISSLAQPSCRAALEALEFGAVEVLAKPGGPYSVGELRHTLAEKIRAAAASRPRPATVAASPVAPAAAPTPAPADRSFLPPETVIAIGASTGGTEAIASVLLRLPANTPGILVTQHIPPGFSRAFAERLNANCRMDVKEAEDGDALRDGLALVAPGDFHMVLRRAAGRFIVNVRKGPRVCYQRPSVDVLFQSVSETAAARAIGVLLTGMGSDGAQGLLRMRQAGAHTIAQDEASCVVFGMPREAIALGAAAQVLPLSAVAAAILSPRRVRATLDSASTTSRLLQ